MTASLRNALKRKTHKERAQPGERRRYGLLEKQRDYVLRAKDFHKKEETLNTLRGKAALRNPDEFYFAMEKQRTKSGVHVASTHEAAVYTADELKLLTARKPLLININCSRAADARRGLCGVEDTSREKGVSFSSISLSLISAENRTLSGVAS